MKKLSILFLSVVALATTITSCSKSDSPAPPATLLDITVTDQTSAIVSGASVYLYSDDQFSTFVDSTVTDATGLAKFSKNLKAQIYYFQIGKEDGCLNNQFTGYFTNADGSTTNTTPTAIVAGKTNTQKAFVVPFGAMTFTNTSTTTGYNVYTAFTYNGSTGAYQQAGSTPVAAGTTTSQATIPALGTYNIQFRPVDATTGNESTDPTTFITKTAVVVTACKVTNVTNGN